MRTPILTKERHLLIFLINSFLLLASASDDIPSCSSKIYCQGDLLRVVQTADIFKDSKSFVDKKMLYDENTIHENFNELMKRTKNNPNRSEVKRFVDDNFANGDELIPWSLPDYKDNPPFLEKVYNETYRNFAQNIVKIWPTLARQIKPDVYKNSERYSLITLPNGFIIPGGRFLEIYYWDSYWVMKGVLISDMPKTAKLILENFLHIVDIYGFVPNGARIYYLNRSHPPLLTPMVWLYMEATNDIEWLKTKIHLLDKELQWFLSNRTRNVQINDKSYLLAHYDSESGSPRPESYLQDVETCEPLGDEEKIKNCYADLKSAAESGWDFSFRWVFDENGTNNANRTFIQTRRVIPVDLNSILAMAFRDLALLYKKVGNADKYKEYKFLYVKWKTAIQEVLYDNEKEIWLDYDPQLNKHRDYFYPSNIAPLWAELFDQATAQELGNNAYKYLLKEGILNFLGGTPTSLNNTGEQWDYPSAWAPLQSIVIQGLWKSGDVNAQKLARTLAERWVNSNLIGYEKTGEMYEKYDAEHPGQHGGGGEYQVQTGFGWTNGVVLETIVDFFSVKETHE